jgi:PBSX family phage terminase large subunit
MSLEIPQKQPDVCELNYHVLSDKYLKFHKAWRKPIQLLSGAFNTGKTVAAVYQLLFQMIYNPMYYGSTALVVAVTDHHISTQLFPVFEKMLTNINKTGLNKSFIKDRHYTLKKAPYILEFNKGINGGPRIVFASAMSETNLRGHSVDCVMVDDLGSETLNESIWNIIQSRAFRNPRFDGDTRGFIVATCNPSSPSSWVYQRYFHYLQENQPIPKELYLERFALRDNTSMKAQWETIESSYAHDPIAYQKNILGLWVASEGLCYPNFSRDKSVIKDKHNVSAIVWDTEHNKPLFNHADLATEVINAGLDFGQHTACIFLMTKQFDDGTPYYIVFDEYYSDSAAATISLHSRHIKNKGYRISRFYSDWYTESVNSYKSEGIFCTLADKSPGAELAGMDMINRLLYEGRLFIHERCKNVIKEFEGYTWKKDGVPNNYGNHTLDGIRYCLFALNNKSYGSFTLPNVSVPKAVAVENVAGPIVETININPLSNIHSMTLTVNLQKGVHWQ